MSRKFLLALILVTAVSISAAPMRRAVQVPPLFPRCSMVTGTAGVTFTKDRGTTLAPTAERLTGIAYTYGLTALDSEGSLLAWHRSDLILSTDHGCSWRVVATFDDYDFPPRITAGKDGRAYAWSDNRNFLVRYDSRGAVKLKQPAPFIGFAVDSKDSNHVRAGGSDGAVYDSPDGGETWTRIGGLSLNLMYRFAFDPENLDNIFAGLATQGVYRTTDGGRTWSHPVDRVNMFEVIVSPADSRVVWAEGFDNRDEIRHIYLSEDAGQTFRAVVDQSPEVSLRNGNLLAPDPRNRHVLYFVFGTYFQGYGTDIYRYDEASRSLTVAHNDANDVNAIAFSPVQPNLMYLGLESESGGR